MGPRHVVDLGKFCFIFGPIPFFLFANSIWLFQFCKIPLQSKLFQKILQFIFKNSILSWKFAKKIDKFAKFGIFLPDSVLFFFSKFHFAYVKWVIFPLICDILCYVFFHFILKFGMFCKFCAAHTSTIPDSVVFCTNPENPHSAIFYF